MGKGEGYQALMISNQNLRCIIIFFFVVFSRRSPHLSDDGIIRGSSTIEKRFAYNLLEKLLHYVDKAQTNLKPKRDRKYLSDMSTLF